MQRAKAVAPKCAAQVGLARSHDRAAAWQASFQLREARPRHREKPHKLLQVGVIPTPATNVYPAAAVVEHIGSAIAR